MALAGRAEVWEALLAERPRAERVARARCKTRQDAEDCVQEAMARVAAMPDVDVARVGPLVSTVVAHLAVDVHRSRARQERAEPRLALLVRHEPSPEDAVCDVHEARWLMSRTTSLPAQDRAVLEARAAGRSAREAAALLDLTYKAAESSYTRARARMQAIWRATAAALGVLWCGQGRRPRSAAAAGAVTAATAAAMMLLPWVAAPSHPVGPTDVDVGAAPHSGFVRPAPASAAPVAVGPATAPAVPDQLRRERPVPSPSAPAAAPLLTTQPLDNPAAQGFGATVTHERADESLPETLDRCVREGVYLSISRVGCRG